MGVNKPGQTRTSAMRDVLKPDGAHCAGKPLRTDCTGLSFHSMTECTALCDQIATAFEIHGHSAQSICARDALAGYTVSMVVERAINIDVNSPPSDRDCHTGGPDRGS